MNIRVEQTAEGDRRFVHTSHSGRSYRGATPEEVERKTLLAALHAMKRTIGADIAVELCAARFQGICSFGDLSNEQMRDLRNQFIAAMRYGKEMEKAQRLEPLATKGQIKRIVKLGRYSIITERYGTNWFWRKCREWIVRLRYAPRVDLSDLSNQEAWYIIRRLERIEKRLNDHSEQPDGT